ncbi:MAG: DUF4124 domain-containing protein [Nitrosomonadales bacterium]|nr:DUF4124 domain-containing protein [Nitrosomonadales bacterium]
MIKYRLFVALVIGMTFSLPAVAKMYKWVDDKGVTHYGETIPPEYAHRDREELNKAGRVVEKKEVLTPEERHAKELEDIRKREDEEAALEQKRRDKALLNTYSNAKEIDLARARNLQQVEARLNSISSQLKMADDKLTGLQKEADGYTGAGKNIPASLQDDLQESQARLTKLQQDMEKSRAEKAAVEARYDADKARYRELTGKE